MDRTRSTPLAGRGVLASAVAHARSQIAEWGWRRQMRRALGPTSEGLMRDIGLTPDDLSAALTQPLSESASDMLSMVAKERAGNW